MSFNILKEMNFYKNDQSFFELYAPILGSETNGFYNWLIYAASYLTNERSIKIDYELIGQQTQLSKDSINKNFDKLINLNLIKIYNTSDAQEMIIKLISPLNYKDFIKVEILMNLLTTKTSQNYLQMLEFKNNDFLETSRFNEVNNLSKESCDLFKNNFIDQIKLDLWNEFEFNIKDSKNEFIVNEIANKNKLSYEEFKKNIFESLIRQEGYYSINLDKFINLNKTKPNNPKWKHEFNINRDREIFFSSKDISDFKSVIEDYKKYEPSVYLSSIKKESLNKNDIDIIKLLTENSIFDNSSINMILDFCFYKTNGLLHYIYLQKTKKHLIANNFLKFEEIINHFRFQKNDFNKTKSYDFQKKKNDEFLTIEEQFAILNK